MSLSANRIHVVLNPTCGTLLATSQCHIQYGEIERVSYLVAVAVRLLYIMANRLLRVDHNELATELFYQLTTVSDFDLVSEPIVIVSMSFYSKRALISTVFMEVPRARCARAYLES